MRKYLLWIVCLTIQFSAKAQEPPVYSQFFMNPYIYNPAYAGVDGHTVISAMYRQQWTGFDGAPAISHVTFHTPLKGGLGIGAFVYNERQSVLDNSGAKGTVSYLANFDRKHWLRFGLSVGAATSSIDMNEIDNPFDPAFADIVDNSFNMIGDFGVTYHSGNFNFGVSMPRLFKESFIVDQSFAPVEFKPWDNLFIKANYHLGFLDDDFVWEPHILYRYSGQNADQYEIANVIHVAHHIWFGASYRQDAGVVGLFGIKIKEKLAVGYAFELGDGSNRSFTGQTHEVHIGFHLGSKKEHAEHVSSFIKRHRKTAEERREERLAELEEGGGEDNALLAVSDDPIDTPDTDTPDIETPGVDTPDTGVNAGAVAAGAAAAGAAAGAIAAGQDQPDEQPVVEQTPTVVPGTQNPIDQSLTDDRRTPDELAQSDTPLRVRSGNHMLELAPGNYIINGAFRVFDHAEDFSDQLFERGFHDVKVGYVTATGYYYVVVNKMETLSNAQSRATQLRSRQGFEKTWVLTVE